MTSATHKRGRRQISVEVRRVVVLTVTAFAVFAAATIVSTSAPAAWEIESFRAMNALPDWVLYVIWPFMQFGVFATIPVATGVAWWRGRHRLAALMLVAGTSVYLGAKVIKRVAGRDRPTAFLGLVQEREDFAIGSIGYLSGHAAVAGAIATLIHPHLTRGWRIAATALVVVVMVGRVYVGGHFALDVVGGVALGVAAGGVATLASLAYDRRSEPRPGPLDRAAPRP